MTAQADRSPDKSTALWLMIAVVLCLLLQAWLAVVQEINWDEFFYLSHLYDYQRGEMAKVLQSVQVHLLGWITGLPGNEIDQVIAGRFVMLAFLTGTCVLIYQLAREFFSPAASAVAVLAFASAGPTIIHGASFRADPISAFFIMLSLVTLAKGKTAIGPMLLAGGSAAVAAMITIKVGLYAPAFLGVAAWRLREKEQRGRVLKWLAGTAVTAATAFGLLYGLQLWLIDNASNAATQGLLGSAARTTVMGGGLQLSWPYLLLAGSTSPAQTILLVAGAIGVLLASIGSSTAHRFRLFAIGGCGATLLCLLFYRNAFPYFFPFILPPAMMLVAWIVDWSTILKRPIFLALLSATFLVVASYIAKTWSERQLPPQRTVVDAIHRIFPEPVAMIDNSHMIGSFPKRGFFMSSWGLANYYRGMPIFSDILQRDTVPLLLLDNEELADAVSAPGQVALLPGRRLFAEDRAVLRQNYIQHWGPVWVAGKRLEPVGQRGAFDILIPGTYTLEGGDISIDGTRISSGGFVNLERGRHSFETQSQDVRTLRWGKQLARPSEPAPAGSLFTPFLRIRT